MKKQRILALLMALSLGVSALSACGGKKNAGEGASESSSESSSSTSAAHEHAFSEKWKSNSTSHWHLCECGEKADLAKHTGEAANCTDKPVCTVCGKEFGKATGHTFGELKELDSGVMGYKCACGEEKHLVTVENEDGSTVEGLLDFVVEVEAGRDPVILQLSDPQLTDRAGAENRCYKYIRETVAATNPDLILVTGDLVYGCFDKDGAIFLDLIAFMETLETPWAPVFGNHDNECWLGVDWQCEQLEAAENCLFKQGEVVGNGNYSVGVLQGNKLLRTFYMMDSNGCSRPRCERIGEEFIDNPEVTPGANKVKTSPGFDDSQIAWYSSSIEELKKAEPDVKISFAYHIQQAYFLKAYEQYGFNGQLKEGSSSELKYPLNFDAMEDAKEGDIGYLGRTMKGPWDTSYGVFAQMKKLGADSLFVGHEHCNSASVVFNGVRFQYGQKSSTYDRYNSIDAQGNIVGSYSNAGKELIGGTAFYLSQEDGSIFNPYIYLCGDPLGMNPKKA